MVNIVPIVLLLRVGEGHVTVGLKRTYHGSWDAHNDPAPSSLITFQFKFHTRTRGNRFKKAVITIAFEDGLGQAELDPEVARFAPDGFFALPATLQTQTTGTTFKAGFSAKGMGVEMGADWSHDLLERKTISASATITGRKTYVAKESGNPNAARFDLVENPLDMGGIPASIDATVLLRHEGALHRKFRAKILFEAETAGGSLLGGVTEIARRKLAHHTIDFSPLTNPAPEELGNPVPEISIHNLHAVNLPALIDVVDNSVQAAHVEEGQARPALIQLDEGATREQKLFHCARGLYDAAWYKFRRFDTLSLLNLYHYQDRLVQLEKKINNTKGQMTPEDIANLATLLREYHGAMKTFKDISLMDRPPQLDQTLAAQVLGDKLEERSYISAGELGMVDFTPEKLGSSSDPVRVLLQKLEPVHQGAIGQTGPAGYLAPRQQVLDTKLPPGKPNPAVERVSPTVDKLARLLVSLVGGMFLLAPMYALTFIPRQRDQLITVGLFVLFFAVVVAMATKAQNQELLAATATYAAVLVVFVSQKPSSSS